MKKLLFIVFSLIASATFAQNDVTTIYIIRHAEQGAGEDASLTEEGKDRTEKWGDYFEDKNITTYYTTKHKRAIETVTGISTFTSGIPQPGTSRQFVVKNYEGPEDLLLKQVGEDHKGESVLIVGHSDTIHKYINILLETDKFTEIDEEEYGNLYIVTLRDGKPEIERLQM